MPLLTLSGFQYLSKILYDDFKLLIEVLVLKYMDEIISICQKCGFTIGIFIPGMECPECGELIIP